MVDAHIYSSAYTVNIKNLEEVLPTPSKMFETSYLLKVFIDFKY